MAVSKLNILLKQEQKLFHTQDLGTLWNIQNRNTLYTAISRFLKRGVIYQVQKGLYSVVPLVRLDPVQVGVRALHRYAYLTTESILAQAGIISQLTYRTTFASDISRTFTVASHQFLCRKLKPQFLHNTTGIALQSDGILVASTERAIADMLYFQPSYHFDARAQIDWQRVKRLQHEVGYL